MQRAQIVEPSKPLVISRVAIPPAPRKGLVIKTSFSGICHSDLHQWENTIKESKNSQLRFTDNPFYKLPVVPGHEISGIVYSLGAESDAGSEDLKVGDRVVVYPWIGCGKCGHCVHGDHNICSHRHKLLGMMIPGGYASYVAVREKKFAVKLPDTVPLDVACMFSCSGLTTFNAVSTAKPTVEKAVLYKGKANILIVGAGALGLWCIQMAKHILPASTVITVADVNEEKLQVARERGCHATLCWNSSKSDEITIEQAKKIDGYDAIIDFVNTTATANRVFNCLSMAGMLVMVGLFGGMAHFSLPRLVVTAKSVKGVFVGNLQSMKDMINLVASEKLMPPPIKYFKLEEVTSALQLMQEGKMPGRGVINFSGGEISSL